MGEQDEEIEKELSQFMPANSTGEAASAQSVTNEVDLSQLPPQLQLQVMAHLSADSPGVVISADDGQTQSISSDPDPAARQAEPVALDDATIALASSAASPPWYASWVGAVVILVLPVLLTVAGFIGGDANLQAWGIGGILFLFICGFPLLGLPWLALFMNFRDRVQGVRTAIDSQRGWSITGPINQVGGRSIVVAGAVTLSLVRRTKMPAWARTAQCTVLFADRPRGAPYTVQGTVISITGPSGRLAYPPSGGIPVLLRAPAVVASILFSIGFTAACNAQSQTYADAASRMRDIEAAANCTKENKPGDDCLRWVSGTVTRLEGHTILGASPQPVNSSCTVLLKWAGGTQQGDIRVDGVDCTQQLPITGATPATIELVRNFAIQAKVGETTYQTDRWPPVGDTVYSLALVYRIATILWFAWPFIHAAAALIYRFAAPRPAETPQPETVAAAGSAT